MQLNKKELNKQLRKTERQLGTTTSTPERSRGRPKARNQPQELPTTPPYPDGDTGGSKENAETSQEPRRPVGRPRKTQPEHDVPYDDNTM